MDITGDYITTLSEYHPVTPERRRLNLNQNLLTFTKPQQKAHPPPTHTAVLRRQKNTSITSGHDGRQNNLQNNDSKRPNNSMSLSKHTHTHTLTSETDAMLF